MKAALKNFLDNEGCYSRSEHESARKALLLLGVSPHSLFFEFYETYGGPFGSEHIGFTLSDIVRGNDLSIVRLTNAFWEKHNFLKQHLVISDICGYAVLVYDCITDSVYDVDFEGGADRLQAGTLDPDWSSFEAFLDFFFLGIE